MNKLLSSLLLAICFVFANVCESAEKFNAFDKTKADCSLGKGANPKNFRPRNSKTFTPAQIKNNTSNYLRILREGQGGKEKQTQERLITGQKFGTPGREQTVNELFAQAAQARRRNKGSQNDETFRQIFVNFKEIVPLLDESKSLKNKARRVVKKVTKKGDAPKYARDCLMEDLEIKEGSEEHFDKFAEQGNAAHYFDTFADLVSFIDELANTIAAMAATKDPEERKRLDIIQQGLLRRIGVRTREEAFNMLAVAAHTLAAVDDADDSEELRQQLHKLFDIIQNNLAARARA
ncbi:MAG: hypothetical protein LBF84_04380 [Holosporales bacterium]|jgi:hypothetical protein|nr:hypothetical protein [Holosporales bacterium]